MGEVKGGEMLEFPPKELLFSVPVIVTLIVAIISLPFWTVMIRKRNERQEEILAYGHFLAGKFKDQFVNGLSPDMRKDLEVKPKMWKRWHRDGIIPSSECMIVLEVAYRGKINPGDIKQDVNQLVASFLKENPNQIIGIKLNFPNFPKEGK